MKRLILVMSAALVFAAEAKLEKVAEITVANQQQVVTAANKIGEFINNPMLGMLVSAQWSLNPVALGGIGAMRADGKPYAAIYVDGYKKGMPLERLDGKIHFVALYPAHCTKEQYLDAKPEAKETAGVIDFDDSGEIKVVFAEDGKYVAFSDKPELAKKALTGIAKIPKLPRDRIMSIRVTPAGMNILNDVVDGLNKELKLELSEQDLESFRSVAGFTLTCGIGSYGVDYEINADYKPGSLETKLGSKPLSSPAPLAFAGRDSFLAQAVAEDSIGFNMNDYFLKLVRFANKWGIETYWLKTEKDGGNVRLILDITKFCMYVGLEAEKKYVELSEKSDEILADFNNTFKFARSTKNPEQGLALCIKDAKFADAQSRFDKTLPGYSRKPCTSAGVWSLYGTIYGTLNSFSEMFPSNVDDPYIRKILSLVKALPDVPDAAIAFATIKQGPTKEKMIIRINPAEIKGLYPLVMELSKQISSELSSSSGVDDEG